MTKNYGCKGIATACFLILSIAFNVAYANTTLDCSSRNETPAHKLKVEVVLVNDTTLADVDVSLLDETTGKYNRLVGCETVTATEFNPRDPSLTAFNRFQIQKSRESSYNLFLPKNISELISNEANESVEALIRVAFDEGRPFTDKLDCRIRP